MLTSDNVEMELMEILENQRSRDNRLQANDATGTQLELL